MFQKVTVEYLAELAKKNREKRKKSTPHLFSKKFAAMERYSQNSAEQIKIPYVPVLTKDGKRALYLYAMAKLVTKETGKGYITRSQMTNILWNAGYAHKNAFTKSLNLYADVFRKGKLKNGIATDNYEVRYHLPSPEKLIEILLNGYTDKKKLNYLLSNGAPLRTLSYVVKIKIAPIKLNDFKSLYIVMTASKPSSNPHDYKYINKEDWKIGEQYIQEIDTVPSGRSYNSIGIEAGVSKQTAFNQIKKLTNKAHDPFGPSLPTLKKVKRIKRFSLTMFPDSAYKLGRKKSDVTSDEFHDLISEVDYFSEKTGIQVDKSIVAVEEKFPNGTTQWETILGGRKRLRFLKSKYKTLRLTLTRNLTNLYSSTDITWCAAFKCVDIRPTNGQPNGKCQQFRIQPVSTRLKSRLKSRILRVARLADLPQTLVDDCRTKEEFFGLYLTPVVRKIHNRNVIEESQNHFNSIKIFDKEVMVSL